MSLSGPWTLSPSNPIIEGADVGLDQIGYPSVIKAQGRLGSPIDVWYLWAAPHDPPGGIYLFTAPAPEGPWTVANSGSPVIPTSAIAGGDHISSPHVMWNPNTSQLMMWAHAGGSPTSATGSQATYLWTGTDGTSWTVANSGNPVLDASGAGEMIDDDYAAYLHVIHDGSQFVGFYQGSNSTIHTERIAWATSPDGTAWTKQDAVGKHAPWWPPSVRELLYLPVHSLLDGALHVIYHSRPQNPGVTTFWTRYEGPGDAWSYRQEPSGLDLGGSGTYNANGMGAGDLVLHDGKLWLFGTAASASSGAAGETVFVASTPFSGTFDTTWGKG